MTGTVWMARDRAILDRAAGAHDIDATSRRSPGSRHCWVRRGDAGVEGLLVAWVRGPGGWLAEVVVVDDDDGAARLVTVPTGDVLPAR